MHGALIEVGDLTVRFRTDEGLTAAADGLRDAPDPCPERHR